MPPRLPVRISCLVAFTLLVASHLAGSQTIPAPTEGDFTIANFHFRSGESLPSLKLHYTTLGAPHRAADSHIDNAILLLHGTGGNSHSLLVPQFANVLFGPGQLLDASKYYIILTDGIGHGSSSKPSDGLHAHFPKYDYDDMVAADHELLATGLHVDHLRLILGTSMGCMESFVWGETYPTFSSALMPLACLPVPIAGRNRMMRKMAMDAITQDPDWNNGDYKSQPPGLKTAVEMVLIMGSSPLQMQKQAPTRDAADAYLEKYLAARMAGIDANDFVYQFNASRNYDPSPRLESIVVPMMYINSADDFINPPELGIAQVQIKRVPHGKFVLLPITDETRGHGTHTLPAIWQSYLKELLDESKP